MVWSAEEESSVIDYYRGKLTFFPKPYLWFGIQTFCSGYFHSLLLSSFILLAWWQGVAVACGKAAKGRFDSVYIFIFGFMKVQLTERIFIIYNFKENRCL